MYCHGNGTKKNPYCKWLKFIGIKKHNKSNCEFAKDCDMVDEGHYLERTLRYDQFQEYSICLLG